MGATGKALTELGILQSFEWAQFAHLLFTRGFILSLFMAIGSRLYPALSGVLRVEIVKNTNSSGDSIKFQKLMHGFLALCFFGGLAIESFSQSDLGIGTGLFVQFLVITIEVGALWKMYRKPAPFMRSWMLSVSSWSMILGYAIAMMAPNLRTHCLHIVYVAGFLGGTLAVGAHVLVNHEAMDQALLKNFWPLGFIGALVIAATILRVGAVIDENYYALLSGAASITLVIALSFWGGTYIDPLWRRAK